MGKIVGAFGQSHILFDDEGCQEQAGVVFDGYKAIGQKVRDLNPDLIVVISDDHMFNIHNGIQVPLGVGVGDRYRPIGDMSIPTEHLYQGHRDFGEGLVAYATAQGFDLAKLEEESFRPDHGFMIPVMFCTPDRQIPFVPINVNINTSPAPSPKRCWELGGALKRYIEAHRPVEERVVIIGTGGLSHWLMIERHGEINEQWDKEMLDLFVTGRVEELCHVTSEEIVDVAGNGGTEITCWMVMAGAVPGAKGEVLYYEPMYPWLTGCGGVEMHV